MHHFKLPRSLLYDSWWGRFTEESSWWSGNQLIRELIKRTDTVIFIHKNTNTTQNVVNTHIATALLFFGGIHIFDFASCSSVVEWLLSWIVSYCIASRVLWIPKHLHNKRKILVGKALFKSRNKLQTPNLYHLWGWYRKHVGDCESSQNCHSCVQWACSLIVFETVALKMVATCIYLKPVANQAIYQ